MNQITISCTGVSATKANQLIELMNRILAQRLDLSQVNAKLDQLGAEVGSLNETLNPLGKAPQGAKNLLAKTESETRQCYEFSSKWASKDSQQTVTATQQAIREASQQALANRNRAMVSANSANSHELEEFQDKLAPRFDALIARFRAAMPNVGSFPDTQSVRNGRDFSDLDDDMSNLHQRYMLEQQAKGQPLDSKLVLEYNRLSQDSMTFYKQWMKASNASLSTSLQDNQTLANPAGAGFLTQSAKSEPEVALYLKTLEPNLAELKNELLQRLPGRTSDVDYRDVQSVSQLGIVCTDLGSLGMAYRDKVAADLSTK